MTLTRDELIELGKDARRKYQREWQRANRDKVNKYQRNWKAKNKDKVKEYQRRWRAENKDKAKEYEENRLIKLAKKHLEEQR